MNIHIEDTAYRGIQRYYHKDWNIEAFNIPRNKIKNKEYKDLGILGHSIYFLYGEDEQGNLKIYVGRSSDTEKNIPVFTRLHQHVLSTTENYRDVWDTAIAIKFNKLTFDDMRHLENYFFKALLTSVKLNEVEPDTDAYKYDSIKHKVEYIKSYVNYILKEDVFSTEEKHEAKKDVPRLDYSDTELKNQGKRLIDKDFETVTEIQTPNEIVEQMLDLLPAEVWGPDTKFLDLACKSGEYLKAIFNRLMESNLYIGTPYENTVRRTIHIISDQLYGIALSDVSYDLTKENLGSTDNIVNIDSLSTILNKFNIIRNETLKLQTLKNSEITKSVLNKSIKIIEKSKNEISALGIRENTFEEYIKNKLGVNKDMKFNVIIGNPPYQEASKSIYNEFIDTAINLKADHISMIVKNNWLQSEVLKNTRDNMISTGIREIINYPVNGELFPNVDVTVSIFYISNGYIGDTHFKEIRNGNVVNEYNTNIKGASIILSNVHQQNVLNKVQKYITGNGFGEYTYPAECFRINSNGTVGRKESVYNLDDVSTKDGEHNVAVIYINSSREPYLRYIKLEDVPSRVELVNKYKVLCGSVLSNDKYVLRNLHVVNPMTVATKSWGLVFTSDSVIEATNVCKYLKTKFVRFLIRPFCGTGVNCMSAYRFSAVPVQNFTSQSDINWSVSITDIDNQLYEKYSLSQEEIEYIENTIASYDKLKLTEQDGAAALVNKLINNN